jgi:hypothetical protein
MRRAAGLRTGTCAALGCALGLLACTEPRLIGRACPNDDCRPTQSQPAWPILPAPLGCGMQLSTRVLPATGETDTESCELFTLSELGAADTAYLTRLQLVMTPLSHVDVRLTAQLPMPDGKLPCSALWSLPIEWVPLLEAAGDHDDWDFRAAPYAVQPGSRVLIDYRYIDLEQRALREVGAKLNLECQPRAPAVVTQSFRFERSPAGAREVARGQSALIAADCPFSEAVVVSRLYRPTHHVVRYRVRRSETSSWLWETDERSAQCVLERSPPLVLQAGAGLHWECEYENQEDTAFVVGGSAPDACALFGNYHLPAGGSDHTPEYCGPR